MSFVPKFFSSVFGGGGGGGAPAVPAVPPPAPVAPPPAPPAAPTAAPQPPSFIPTLSPGQKAQKASITATSVLGAAATAGQSAQKTATGGQQRSLLG
jgi:hypothetical protein